MTDHAYNYAVFDLQRDMGKFTEFQNHPLHVGTQALDFPLENLTTGHTTAMKDLWRNGLAVIEFGSYT